MADAGADAVALLSELVSIDSVNPGLVAGAAGEQRIAGHLAARLERSGFDTTLVPMHGHAGRPSLVAVPPDPADGPTVVLNGHLDTVGVTGMTDPFAPRVAGDRLYGRGAADMKGGVADEEDANLGSEAVIAALPGLGVRPDVCLIAEPTDLTLTRSLRGFAVVRPRFAGRAAHSSQTEAGLVAHRDGWRLDDAGPAATLSAELGDALGTGPTFDAPYWMEAPLWQQLCPTLICGPSGGGLHAVEEWVDVGQVRTFATALVQVLRGWTPRGH